MAQSNTGARPRILCVDDEPFVLEAIAAQHGRHFQVECATSGTSALELLSRIDDVAVVVSDMRMPGMDGARFLAEARVLRPEAVRLLLTGHADVEAAIRAINDGQVFQFLTKPCQPAALRRALDAGVRQHELIVSERVLLEQTLHGAVKALVDVLALSHPTAFGRAIRLRQLVGELGARLALPQRWQLEVAAMLSQLGHVALPAETADKLYYGHGLSEAEREMVAQLPDTTDRLIVHIPRLEGVRAILARALGRPALDGDESVLAAEILRAAIAYDVAETRGAAPVEIVAALSSAATPYRSDVLEALKAARAASEPREVRQLPLAEVVSGMVLAEDVTLPSGTLLAARGYEITPRFIERVLNFPREAQLASLRVFARRG